MKIVFATNNAHKVKEFNEILRGYNLTDKIEIVAMGSVGHTTDLPETHETIIENAIEKAEYLHTQYQVNCFSEDSGLEIDFLNGKPGVHSAYYSGSRDATSNINLVLQQMGDTPQRTARFRTIIHLIMDGEKHTFEGVCEGSIRLEPSGTEGFGYDPIFEPEGYHITFAEMDADTKNAISHRGKATRKLLAFLKERFQ